MKKTWIIRNNTLKVTIYKISDKWYCEIKCNICSIQGKGEETAMRAFKDTLNLSPIYIYNLYYNK